MKLTTRTIDLISRPLAQTLVAINIFTTPFLKSQIVNSLSSGSIAPCRTSEGQPYFSNYWNKKSASVCLSTNIRMLPFQLQMPKIYSILHNFEVSSRTSMICSTFAHACPRLPTITSTGLFSILRAKISTFLGKVAENNAICLMGLILSMILVICGQNPRSNILSAQSITKKVTLFRFVIFPLFRVRISIILPGVQTTSSAPCLNSASWFCTDCPP